MPERPSGIACLRNEVLFVEADRVHLSGDRELQVTPVDRLLLDLVQAGDGDLDLLEGSLREGLGAERFDRDDLLRTVLDPRSVVELVPHFDVETPDVIVVDFSKDERRRWSAELVRTLRRGRRVLYVGDGKRVRGSLRRNLSFGACKRAEMHGDWFRFIQWVRGTLRRFEGATLVLCGGIDAILFSDLVPFFRTVTCIDEGWPQAVGVGGFSGTDWIPETLVDERRELFFALRFGGEEVIGDAHAGVCSSFAVLEAHAMRYSERLVVTATDQLRELIELGVDPDRVHSSSAVRLAEPHGWEPAVEEGARPGALLVEFDGSGELDALGPLFQLLEPLRAAGGSLASILVRAGGLWREFRVEGEAAVLGQLQQPPPPRAASLASLVPVGMSRGLGDAWTVLAGDAPAFLIPSSAPHPILASAPPELVLEGVGEQELGRRLEALADPTGDARREHLESQHRFVAQSDLTAIVRDVVAGVDRSVVGGEALGGER